MDALRLASGMSMGMGMEVVSGALQSARDTASASMETASANMASTISSSVDSLKNTSMADVSSGVLSATSTLKDSATAGLSSAAASATHVASQASATINDHRAALSTMGAASWPGTCMGTEGAGSAEGVPGRGARSADEEEDSQSGGEDGGGKQARTSSGMGALMGVVGAASRLGAFSRAEKEQLVPKGPEEEMEEGRRRSFGAGVLPGSLSGLGGSLSSLGQSVGQSMGIVEKQKEPETRCGRLCRCCPALTYQQRMLGFGICFCLGGILSLSALSSIGSIFLGNPAPFAVKYTLGNLLSIGSSSFLVGPAKQCRDSLAPERAAASIIYLLTLLGTLLSVFVLKVQLLSLLCVIAQFSALTWYMLSYVPYGQQCAKRMVKRFL